MSARITTTLLMVLATGASATEVHEVVYGRANLRVRSPLAGDKGTTRTTDVELLPNGEVTLGWVNTQLLVQYNPSIVLREPQLLGEVSVLHRGRIGLSQHLKRANLQLMQELAAGTTDVSALVPTDGTPLNNASGAQTVTSLPYERFASMALLDAAPSDHTALLLNGGYLIQGSPVTNVTLPLQWGPLARAHFRATVSSRNALITNAQYQSATFATGQQQLVASLTQAYERVFSREVTASLGAGLALTQEHLVAIQRGPIPGDYREVLPVAVAALNVRGELGHSPVTLIASSRLGPFADRYTGYVYERIEGQFNGEWRFQRPWWAVANAGFAYAVPLGSSAQVGDRLYYGEGGARWAPFTWLLLGVLGRVVWSEQPRLALPGQLQWLVTFSCTVRDERSVAW